MAGSNYKGQGSATILSTIMLFITLNAGGYPAEGGLAERTWYRIEGERGPTHWGDVQLLCLSPRRGVLVRSAFL